MLKRFVSACWLSLALRCAVATAAVKPVLTNETCSHWHFRFDAKALEGTAHDNEGSGFGFKTLRCLEPRQTEQATTCKMERP